MIGTFVIMYSLVTTSYQDEGVLGEYCRNENFEVECAANEVIVMEQARFGRMKYGRCIQKYDKGCSSDVMHILDITCSGRRLCEMSVSDPKFINIASCESELANYLEAKYRCQPVYTKHTGDCETSEYIYQPKHPIHLPPRSGHIASMYSTPTCPYKIEASQGQRIALSLDDFAANTNRTSAGDGSATPCQRLFIINEPNLMTPICRTNYKQRINIYVSQSHMIDVEIIANETPFLVHYSVIGCRSVTRPSHSYFVQNTDNKVIIRCNNTGEVFELNCQDGKWVGDSLRNCSNKKPGSDKAPGSAKPATPEQHEDSPGLPPLGMSLFIIFGVALVIVIYVAGMIVCFMYIKRKRKSNDRIINAPRKLEGSEEALQYDKIFTNPQEERRPMLSKMGTLRPQPKSDYSETVCHIHGPINHSSESPYIVAGSNFCQCENCTNNIRSATLQGCCIPTQSTTTKLDDSAQTYESSRSLKGVRFATVNGTGKANKNGAFYLELNTRRLDSSDSTIEKCPDLLVSDAKPAEKETQLSTFR